MLDRNNQVQLKSLNKSNPIGIKLEFKLDGETAQSVFTLNEKHQGPNGRIHDGIIAFLMDVGMGWIARHAAGVNSVTAKLEVDFHRQALTGEALVMTVRITKKTSRLLEESVRIENRDGILIAEGSCIQYIMGPNRDASGMNRD
jgi:uncharacterized protein (TIGR00369 family)